MVLNSWKNFNQYKNIPQDDSKIDINESDTNEYIPLGHRQQHFQLNHAKNIFKSFDRNKYNKINTKKSIPKENACKKQPFDQKTKSVEYTNTFVVDGIEWEDNSPIGGSEQPDPVVLNKKTEDFDDLITFEKPDFANNSANVPWDSFRSSSKKSATKR